MIKSVLLGALAYEGVIQSSEILERHRYYNIAKKLCSDSGKPMLRVGMKRWIWEPPNPDFTIDIDPAVLRVPGGVCADERSMPFYDKQFGACFNEHTLEHLGTLEDVSRAVSECVRVADTTVILCPSPYSIHASLFSPTHNQRIWLEHSIIKVSKNFLRTGLGYIVGPDTSTRGYFQALMSDDGSIPVVRGSGGIGAVPLLAALVAAGVALSLREH